MRKAFQRSFAILLSLMFMVANCSTVSLAAEVPNSDEVQEINIQFEGMDTQESEGYEVVPLSTYNIINTTKTISSNSVIPFSLPGPAENIKLVMCARYSDGHTGGASVRFGNYMYAVPVDGVSRTYDTSIVLGQGSYNFYISGVNGTMTITIHLYK